VDDKFEQARLTGLALQLALEDPDLVPDMYEAFARLGLPVSAIDRLLRRHLRAAKSRRRHS